MSHSEHEIMTNLKLSEMYIISSHFCLHIYNTIYTQKYNTVYTDISVYITAIISVFTSVEVFPARQNATPNSLCSKCAMVKYKANVFPTVEGIFKISDLF